MTKTIIESDAFQSARIECGEREVFSLTTSPMRVACEVGHLDVLKLLIEYCHSDLSLVRYWKCWLSDEECWDSRWLFDDEEPASMDDRHPVVIAASAGAFDIVIYLLERYPELTQIDTDAETDSFCWRRQL